MVSLAVDAVITVIAVIATISITAVLVFVMPMLGESLCAALVMPHMMFGIMTTRMAAIYSVTVATMPRMLMGADIMPGVPEMAISPPAESPLDMVAGPVQGVREFIFPVHRGE